MNRRRATVYTAAVSGFAQGLFLVLTAQQTPNSSVAALSVCDLGGATDFICLSVPENNVSDVESDSFPALMNQSTHESEEEKQAQVISEANQLLEIADSTAFSRVGNLPHSPSLINSCHDGTSVKLEGLNLISGVEMRRQTPYSFRVNVNIDLGPIIGDSNPETVALYFRFFLCDALQIHFCNTHVPSPVNETVILIEEQTGNQEVVLGLTDYRNNTVATPWMIAYETITGSTTRVSIKDLEVQFGLSHATPLGFYRLMFHSVLMTLEDTSSPNESSTSTMILRLDTTGVGSPSILEADEETQIMTMSPGVEILIYVLIGIYDAIAIVSFAFLVIYRNHAAIRLAQGEFLVALVTASIVSSTFVFTLMPNKDWYCMARGPLVQIPFSFVAAILVARLWRVYIALSGAMKIGRRSTRKGSGALSKDRSNSSRISRAFFGIGRLNLSQRLVQGLTFLAKVKVFPQKLCSKSKMGERMTGQASGSPFRRKASSRETWQLVIILCFPQIVLQISGVLIYRPELELETDSSGSVGRYFCSQDWKPIQIAGAFLTFSMFLLAVMLAWQGRNLPSVFNEKTAIFNTAGILSLILLVQIVVVEVADSVTTSPDSSVFVRCTILLAGSGLVLYNLIWPKIRRAVSGETIVVGNLLREYGGVSKKDTEATADARRPTFLAGAPIPVHKNDPLPGQIDHDVHRLYELLGVIVHKCGYGTALSRRDWDQMIRRISKLKIELDRVQLDFVDEEGKTNEEAQTGLRGLDSIEDVEGDNEDADVGLGEEDDTVPKLREHTSLVDSAKKSTSSSGRSVRFSDALTCDSKESKGDSMEKSEGRQNAESSQIKSTSDMEHSTESK